MSSRPYIPIRGIIGGALLGLSVVVLLQQFAVVYPTAAITALAVGGAVLIVLVLANLLRATARRPPVGVAPVAAATAATAAPGFRATHRTPATGADTFDTPGAAATGQRLDPGLDVAVIERTGDWAHVRCSNGWETWVDGRLLVER